jgi:hypothetical protein
LRFAIVLDRLRVTASVGYAISQEHGDVTALMSSALDGAPA